MRLRSRAFVGAGETGMARKGKSSDAAGAKTGAANTSAAKPGTKAGAVPQEGYLRGLANYGDTDFSIYMCRAFARSMGYSLDELSRPVVGIANTLILTRDPQTLNIRWDRFGSHLK